MRLAWAGPRSLDDVRRMRIKKSPRRVYYAATTCWWTVDTGDICSTDAVPECQPPAGSAAAHALEVLRANGQLAGIPCDPRGAPLLMCDEVEEFLDRLAAFDGDGWSFYGPYGYVTLLAAYHGNLVARRPDGAWAPTSFQSWAEYTLLLEAWDCALGQRIATAERLLAGVATDLPHWHILAHARTEHATRNLLVCARDLELLARSLGEDVNPWNRSGRE